MSTFIEPAIDTVTLEVMRVGVSRVLSRYNLSSVDPVIHSRLMAESMAVELCAYITGRKQESREISYPLNWWEAFKARWFPAWLLRRYPVRNVVLIAERLEFFPDVKPLPGHRMMQVVSWQPARLKAGASTDEPEMP